MEKEYGACRISSTVQGNTAEQFFECRVYRFWMMPMFSRGAFWTNSGLKDQKQDQDQNQRSRSKPKDSDQNQRSRSKPPPCRKERDKGGAPPMMGRRGGL